MWAVKFGYPLQNALILLHVVHWFARWQHWYCRASHEH